MIRSKFSVIFICFAVWLIGSAGPAPAQYEEAEWGVLLNTHCPANGAPLTLPITADDVEHFAIRDGCSNPVYDGSAYSKPGKNIYHRYSIT